MKHFYRRTIYVLLIWCTAIFLSGFSSNPEDIEEVAIANLAPVTLVSWDFAGAAGNQTSTAGTSSDVGITAADFTRGASLNSTSAGNSISSSGWDSGDDRYFSFGFTVEAGREVDLNELFIATRSSNTGPGELALRSSLDGFTTNIAEWDQSGTSFNNQQIDLSGFSQFQGITGSIEFRVVSRSSTSANGGTVSSGGTLRVVNHNTSGLVNFTGTVNVTGPAPIISASPTAINYGNVAPTTAADETILVTGSNLTVGINADILGGNVSAFSVSNNETVYDESVVLSSAGGSLYVRFSPPASGVYTETLRLSSTGAQSVDITLTGVGFDENALVSLSAVGAAYTQNFDVLANTSFSSDRPEGWFFVEQGSGANDTYREGTGSSTSGDTYSFGASNDTDRALGSLASGSVAPIYLGGGFENTSINQVYNGFDISYFAELWRRGSNSEGDFLTFYYSTDASSLGDDAATWVEYDPLTARASDINLAGSGAQNGNSSSFRSQYNSVLSGLAVFPGETVWFRWVDTNISGSDDGLAIDDFEITPSGFNAADPFIIPLTQNIDFGQVFITTDSDVTEFDLVVDNLSNDITISSTQASFQVSTDGVNFNPSVTLPSSGGRVYVKFSSASEGNFNGTIEFASSSVVLATVDVSAIAIDPFNNIITIADARTKLEGEFVAVEGVVTVGKEFGSGPSYIQDATGGIPFFNSNFTSQIEIGDKVRVYGPISFFNDLKQISGSNFIGVDVTTSPEFIVPQIIPLAELGNYEGQLVTVQAEFENKNFVFSPNSNENVLAGGITREVRITGTTNIPGLAKPQSTTEITGVVGQFRGTPQLLPRFEQDIQGAELPVVAGAEISRSQTLDVVTYNLEFFGASTNTYTESFGPTDVTLQAANVKILLDSIDADIYAIQEVSDANLLQQVVNQLSGYSLIMSDRYSYSWQGFDPSFAPQQIGFIYKTSTITALSNRVMFEEMFEQARAGQSTPLDGYPTGTASSFYSSGRLPFLLVADVNIGGIERRVNFINVHAKSGGSDLSDYNRRLFDATVLKDSIDQYFVDQDIIFLGDFNDELEGSILTSQSESPYSIFFEDFLETTRSLGANGARSTIGFSNVIDHIMASNTFEVDWIDGSETIITPFRQITDYGNTTSDHLPVHVRFQLKPRLTETEQTFIDEFYNELNGEGWFNNSGWVDGDGNPTSGESVSFRFGLTVEKVNPVTVTEIKLPRNNLTGEFPISLLNFSFLKTLDLSGNNIVGLIPREILNLKYLENLDISYNGLYTNDPEVKAFLDALQPGWEETQTAAPLNVKANLLNPSAIISWTPIPYQGGTGRYFIKYRAEDAGGFTTVTVEGKDSSEGLIPNLEYGKKYLVYVQSQTDANPPFNPSSVTSELSEVIELFFATTVSATERAGLISLYEAMGGDEWTNNDNWKDPVNFSKAGTEFLWNGVTLSKVDGVNWSVTGIDLSNNNLTGTLPDIFAAFPNLISLNLAGNCLEGAVPLSLSSLENLVSLNLSQNRFNSFSLTNLSATDVNLSYNALGEGDDNITLLAQLQADYLATQTIAPGGIRVVINDDTSAEINWEAIGFTTGLGHYEIRLREVGASSWSSRATANKSQSKEEFNTLKANTAYEVQIRTVHIQSEEGCLTFSDWSETITFNTLASLPAKATLSSPRDYMLNTPTVLSLVVNEAAFATSYEIQLSTSQDFTEAETEIFINATGEQEVGDLMTNTRYYWRARGINDRGEGAWSSMAQFRTGLNQATASEEGVIFCATEGTQLLTWEAIEGASHYRVEIATDASFNNVVRRARALQSLQLTTRELAANKTYYWRVQGYNDVKAYKGNWSSTSQLSIQPRIQVIGELELCPNSNSILNLPINEGSSIQWYVDGTAIEGATENSYTVTEAGSYFAILSNDGGAACDNYQTESINITEIELVMPEIAVSNILLCEGESTILSTNASGSSYQWFLNGTAIPGANAQSFSTSEAGSYYVSIRNGKCSIQTPSVAISGASLTLPVLSMSENAEEQLSLGLPVEIQSSEAPFGVGYQWLFNGEPIEGQKAANILAKRSGSYQLLFTSEDGCTMLSDTFVLAYPAGKEPQENDLKINARAARNQLIAAFPNPTSDQVQVSLSNDYIEGTTVNYQVLDFIGRPVISGQLQRQGDNWEANFNMINLKNGLYFIHINDGSTVFKRTLKKE
ncbi:T9SS type A sorting domain-containing protein [Peijinzhouia sedimentorum]